MKKVIILMAIISVFFFSLTGCDKSKNDDTTTPDKCGKYVTRGILHLNLNPYSDSLTNNPNYRIIYLPNSSPGKTTVNFVSEIMDDICTYTDSTVMCTASFILNDTAVHLNFFKLGLMGITHSLNTLPYLGGSYRSYNADTTFSPGPLNSDGPAVAYFFYSFTFPSQSSKTADLIYLQNREYLNCYIKYKLWTGK